MGHPVPIPGSGSGAETDERGIALLYRFALLSGVEGQVLFDLWRRSEIRDLAQGDVLLTAGQRNRSMYLVLSGRLGVYLRACGSEPIAITQHGDTVGELSVLDGQPVCADVLALEPSRVLAVSEDGFWSLIAESHGFALNLLTRLAERLRANNDAVSENARRHEDMRKVAMFDALTGIHNRRWFDTAYPRLIQRARFDGTPLSLLVVDIDQFKRFNDDHGHQAGDAVLRSVAQCMAARLRPTDLLARYGGEEFVVLLPNTDRTGAKRAAERLRHCVVALEIGDGITSGPFKATISVGVAELKHDEDEPASLLDAADRALYRAKAAGRNRVEG